MADGIDDHICPPCAIFVSDQFKLFSLFMLVDQSMPTCSEYLLNNASYVLEGVYAFKCILYALRIILLLLVKLFQSDNKEVQIF